MLGLSSNPIRKPRDHRSGAVSRLNDYQISSKAGFFFLLVLFVLPPLIFKNNKARKDNRQECTSSCRPIRILRQCLF